MRNFLAAEMCAQARRCGRAVGDGARLARVMIEVDGGAPVGRKLPADLLRSE